MTPDELTESLRAKAAVLADRGPHMPRPPAAPEPTADLSAARLRRAELEVERLQAELAERRAAEATEPSAPVWLRQVAEAEAAGDLDRARQVKARRLAALGMQAHPGHHTPPDAA